MRALQTLSPAAATDPPGFPLSMLVYVHDRRGSEYRVQDVGVRTRQTGFGV